ncbi:MAG: hypothetical protein JXA66_00265, partial [Oligoflexia bacterium]|nr:hypothetical protein [Oligoflexia bacterium]
MSENLDCLYIKLKDTADSIAKNNKQKRVEWVHDCLKLIESYCSDSNNLDELKEKMGNYTKLDEFLKSKKKPETIASYFDLDKLKRTNESVPGLLQSFLFLVRELKQSSEDGEKYLLLYDTLNKIDEAKKLDKFRDIFSHIISMSDPTGDSNLYLYYQLGYTGCIKNDCFE